MLHINNIQVFYYYGTIFALEFLNLFFLYGKSNWH
jgi:hypothetical protein